LSGSTAIPVQVQIAVNQHLASQYFETTSRQFEALVVVVKIRGEITVRVALAVVAEEMIEPVLQRAAARVEHAHAPLADARGGVAHALEQLRHGWRVLRQRHLSLRLDLPIGADRAMSAVQAGH
jgi:hypothetical protein